MKVQEKSTPSELRFQQRCRSEALLDPPSTSNISENISLSGGSDSELSVSVSSCKFYETPNKKQKSDTTQNRGNIFIWLSVATDTTYLIELVLPLQLVC